MAETENGTRGKPAKRKSKRGTRARQTVFQRLRNATQTGSGTYLTAADVQDLYWTADLGDLARKDDERARPVAQGEQMELPT